MSTRAFAGIVAALAWHGMAWRPGHYRWLKRRRRTCVLSRRKALRSLRADRRSRHARQLDFATVNLSVTTIAVALVGALGSTCLSGIQARGESFRERRIAAADDFLRAVARTRVALRALETTVEITFLEPGAEAYVFTFG